MTIAAPREVWQILCDQRTSLIFPHTRRSSVSEMRSQLNAAMEPAIEEIRREVAFVLMRLPSRVKNMRMTDFLRECGGDVALLAEKERKAGKYVRGSCMRAQPT